MVDKKGTGWIPDYPDVRDYHIGKIKDKLGTKLQDLQITNDAQEPLAEILDLIRNSPGISSDKIDKIEKTIRGSFKLVKVKALKNQNFLVYGSVGYEVYELQKLLLNLGKYKNNLENTTSEISDFTKSLDELKQVFNFNLNDGFQADNFSVIMEYGYFGKITAKTVKKFKKAFGISHETTDCIVDKNTLYILTSLNQILELRYINLENYQNENQEIRFQLPEWKKSIQDIQNKLWQNLNGLNEYKKLLLLESYQSIKVNPDNNFNRSDNEEDQIHSCGDRVEELQLRLIQLEELNGLATGYFDSLTEQAVRYFQAKYGLKVDGIVGKETWRVLDNLVILKSLSPGSKTLQLDLETLQNNKLLIISASSPTPLELYDIILKIFQISELKVEDFVTDKGFERVTPIDEKELKEKDFPFKEEFQQAKKKLEEFQQAKKELQQAIDLIVKWVSRIISPLAQHTNLETAVKKGLEELEKSFDKWLSHKLDQPQKQQDQETIPALLEVIRELQKQIASKNSNISEKLEQKTNLLKEWKFNPLFIPIALSRVLSFKEAVDNIKKKSLSSQQKTKISKSQQKIDDMFKSLVCLQERRESNNIEFQTEEEKIELLYHKNLRTVIEILPAETHVEPELQKEPDFQGDLQIILIEWDLEKKIRSKQNPDQEENQSNQEKIVNLLLPEFVDLSFWCSPIEDQGLLDSCTAHVGIALMEYFEKRSFDRYIDASRLFLYKVTRTLMHRQGDAGASLRETMKAMALFGVPPEEYWPYEEDKFDEEPTNFCYSFAQSYQALKYFRLNPAGTSEDILLFRIKTVLAAGFPCAFGFTIYYSIDNDSNPRGHIPYPVENDKVKGGHAAVAVGYEDYKVIENTDGIISQGALLIRNSWGNDWGEGGYGWLPYDYVLKGLTADWWSLLKSEWFETRNFGLGEESNWAPDLRSQESPLIPESNGQPIMGKGHQTGSKRTQSKKNKQPH